MLRPLVILGAGGFARETLDVVDAINAANPTWHMLGFIVDSQYGAVGDRVNDQLILGGFDWLDSHRDVYVVCGVGAPEIRRQMTQKAGAFGNSFATLIHPNAILTRWVKMGRGTIITAGCILTNQIRLGDHVHLNLDCTLGHDVVMEDYATLAPGVHVSGNVWIGEGAYIRYRCQYHRKKKNRLLVSGGRRKHCGKGGSAQYNGGRNTSTCDQGTSRRVAP